MTFIVNEEFKIIGHFTSFQTNVDTTSSTIII